MRLKRLLFTLATTKPYHAFIKDTHFPEKARERLWNKEIFPLIKAAPFWFKLINQNQTLDDFNITTYKTYEDALTDAFNTNIQPLNGEKIIHWAETSATAGRKKYFPITSSYQKQISRTGPPYLHHIIKRFPSFLTSKILFLAGVNSNEPSPTGIPTGMMSNFNYRNRPSFIKSICALPLEVFANAQTFKQWAPLYALASDLDAIFAVAPMIIDSIYNQCAEHYSYYLPYIIGEKPLPSYLPKLIISKKRKQYLLNLDKKQHHSFKALWPSLSFVVCWVSGPCKNFAKQLEISLGPDIKILDGAYSATEGWMTVPFESNPLGQFCTLARILSNLLRKVKKLLKKICNRAGN
jgi:hypothetical protein